MRLQEKLDEAARRQASRGHDKAEKITANELPARAARAEPSALLTPPYAIAEELSKLAQLRNQGVLTDAEFDAQKVRLLNGSIHFGGETTGNLGAESGSRRANSRGLKTLGRIALFLVVSAIALFMLVMFGPSDPVVVAEQQCLRKESRLWIDGTSRDVYVLDGDARMACLERARKPHVERLNKDAAEATRRMADENDKAYRK